MAIAENIKKFRKERKMTQKQLGEKCGMYESQIRKYELGTANPKLDTIKKIAVALNVSEAWLMGYEVQGVKIDKKTYHIKLKVNDSIVESTMQAISKHEAIGKVLEIVPTATYKNIIEVKEGT